MRPTLIEVCRRISKNSCQLDWFSSLTLITGNDDSSEDLTSAVEFFATAGQVYQIAVDGYAGTSGNVRLAITPSAAPVNDAFANRTPVQVLGAAINGSNINATKEFGEPAHGGNMGGKSVWWTWTAPSSGIMHLSTSGSSFDTLLGVYTGANPSSLTFITGNDDTAESLASAVHFTVTAGATYQIAVDGYNGSSGSIALKLVRVAPLRLWATQRLADGTCRVWMGTADGSAIDPARLPRIEVYANADLAAPLDEWTRLDGSVAPSSGLFWIDDPAAPSFPMRFYRVRERP